MRGRTLLAAIAGVIMGAGVAAAQPAPIVFAGHDGASAEPASLAANAPGLAGGDERSYGYGAQQTPRRRGAVIDIRRSSPPQRAAAEEETPAAAQPIGERPAWLETERVGPPYEANGRWYVPTPEPGYAETGMASWYGPQFHGQRAANGEVFDQEGLTAAHPTLPLNSLVQVTNLANGREVIVRVTDRGPFVGERLIDMSHAAAVALGYEAQGQTRVHVRYLGPAPRRVTTDAAAPLPAAPPSPTRLASAGEGPQSLLPPAETAAAYQAPQAPVATGRGYFVQVGAFSSQDSARRVQASVEAAGPALVDTRQTAAGAELFRVRVGPWATREEAAAAQRVVADLGYAEAVLATP